MLSEEQTWQETNPAIVNPFKSKDPALPHDACVSRRHFLFIPELIMYKTVYAPFAVTQYGVSTETQPAGIRLQSKTY